MKKVLFSLLAGGLLFAGCVTNPQTNTLEISESRMRQVALVAELAAFNGTTIYLMDHPEKEQIFLKVYADLTLLLNEQTPSLEKFRLIVKSLPVKELQSEKGQLIVDNAVILISAYNQDVIGLDQLEQAKKLKPLISGLQSGLGKALKK